MPESFSLRLSNMMFLSVARAPKTERARGRIALPGVDRSAQSQGGCSTMGLSRDGGLLDPPLASVKRRLMRRALAAAIRRRAVGHRPLEPAPLLLERPLAVAGAVRLARRIARPAAIAEVTGFAVGG